MIIKYIAYVGNITRSSVSNDTESLICADETTVTIKANSLTVVTSKNTYIITNIKPWFATDQLLTKPKHKSS